jgi:putative ABC transport system ATP-binding protein
VLVDVTSSHDEFKADDALIRVQDLTKDYKMGATIVQALRGVDLAVDRGEFVAVMGPSGSGKSTFMTILGCLGRPTSGSYLLEGTLVSERSAAELATIRNRRIGFVFQTFNLLQRASALENVMLPLIYAGYTGEPAKRRCLRALEAAQLPRSRAAHKPNELSGGEQQRVAIARALVTGPAILLADEPTGNLDTRTSEEIMGTLQALNRSGITIVLVTHEPDIASYTKRIVTFQDGSIVDDRPVSPASYRKALA